MKTTTEKILWNAVVSVAIGLVINIVLALALWNSDLYMLHWIGVPIAMIYSAVSSFIIWRKI